MTVRCELALDDYYDASQFFLWRAMRRPAFAVAVVICVGTSGAISLAESPSVGLPILAIFGLGISLMPLSVQWQVRRALRRTPSAFGSFEWTIDERGVRTKAQTSESAVKWEAFIGLEESSRLFLLMLSPNFGHMIPRRAFATPADEASFRTLVQSKLAR